MRQHKAWKEEELEVLRNNSNKKAAEILTHRNAGQIGYARTYYKILSPHRLVQPVSTKTNDILFIYNGVNIAVAPCVKKCYVSEKGIKLDF